MAGTVELIVKEEPVPRFSIGPQKARSPHVAVVYATAAGDLYLLDGGRPMSWSAAVAPSYRTRYEIDLSDHVRTVELRSSPPLAEGGVYGFETVLNVGFRVTDPTEIVRRNIRDGLVVVYGHLVHVCGEITANFPIEEAKAAQDAINARFRVGEVLAEGISIFMCRARLTPDAAAKSYLNAQQVARRSGIVKAAEHEVHVDDAMRTNQLDQIRQSGDLLRRHREREALGDRPLDARELIAVHLERHPEDTQRAFELLAAAEQATYNRQDALDQRQRDLFAFLVQHDLVRPVDIARMRDQVAIGVQNPPMAIPGAPASGATPIAPASSGWDAPLPHELPPPPGIIPVYVVVDESLGPAMADLNAGIGMLYNALVQQPEIANVIRLSVIGFATEVDVQLALATVGAATQPPRLSVRDTARYAAAFQQLLDCIPRDTATLKAQYHSVRRPQVLFLTGSNPADSPQWTEVHRQLVDRGRIAAAPDIVACGVGGVPPETVARIATRPEYAFVSTGTDLGEAIIRFSAFIRSHVLNYGRAVLDGDQGPIIVSPDGFRVVSEFASTSDSQDENPQEWEGKARP
jgi:uncharacterized protein YegL